MSTGFAEIHLPALGFLGLSRGKPLVPSVDAPRTQAQTGRKQHLAKE